MTKLTTSGAEAASPEELILVSGSRIGVIGGGPAGALFSYFLLQMAERIGVHLAVDIYESRDFSISGPAGCNMCGGVISESLIQSLSVEGINLPDDVVQRGIDSFVFHSAEETVTLNAPFHEMRIATVYRGAGPKGNKSPRWGSFDGYLLELASSKGATVIRKRVTDVSWNKGKPQIHVNIGEPRVYDLAVGAIGVKTQNPDFFEKLGIGYKKPRTRKTSNSEFELGSDFINTRLGNSMHAFILDIPNLDFAAIIPKGDYVTMCLIGDKINSEFVEAFVKTPVVSAYLSDQQDHGTGACRCAPQATLCDAIHPFGDRIVLLGDCGMARLNKDGIGSAYRVAKTAAVTALFRGISEKDFREGYEPLCQKINSDNRFGRIIFDFVEIIKKSPFLTRAVMRMARSERNKSSKQQRMSMVLWDMFTGSAPYREVFIRCLHPGFWSRLILCAFVDPGSVKPTIAMDNLEEEIMDRSRLGKNYRAGEVIVRQGEKGDCMYVIQSGKVEVVQTGYNNKEIRLAVLSTGDVFGEMAIFQEEIRSATVRALSKVRVIVVDKRIFLKRVHEDPSFAFTLMQKMSHRIKESDAKLKERRRLAREIFTLPVLIREANSGPDEYETGTVIDISISGIRFLVPKGTILGSKEHKESKELNLIFTLPNERQPIKVTCQSKYLLATDEGVEIGAEFVDPDAQICQTLQKYLT